MSIELFLNNSSAEQKFCDVEMKSISKLYELSMGGGNRCNCNCVCGEPGDCNCVCQCAS